MDRSTYERMLRDIRAIHHALTGHELQVDDAALAAEGGACPPEDELLRRFSELRAEAHGIPEIALELWALEPSAHADLEPPRDAPPAQMERADAEE